MNMLAAYAVEPLKEATRAAAVAAKPSAIAFFPVAAAWNAVLDGLFYDVFALTAEECKQLSKKLLAQGTVLIVHPGEAPDRIEIISDRQTFIDRQRERSSAIKTLVVPGVGSTSIAAAALARNVADALHEPVVAIVPGYGAIDMLADMWGGWYVLGVNNMLLSMAAQTKAVGLSHAGAVTGGMAGATHAGVFDSGTEWPSLMALYLNETSEVSVLRDIFSETNNIRLLVGHSKGALSLAFALHEAALNNSRHLSSDLHVVTLGCVTHFPEWIRASQFLGSFDRLGRFNSRIMTPRTTLPGKMHTLNRLFGWFSVDVRTALRYAGLAHVW